MPSHFLRATHSTPPNLPLARGGAVGGGVLIGSSHSENWYYLASLKLFAPNQNNDESRRWSQQ
jgi:hypothetical protein